MTSIRFDMSRARHFVRSCVCGAQRHDKRPVNRCCSYDDGARQAAVEWVHLLKEGDGGMTDEGEPCMLLSADVYELRRIF